MDPLTGLLDPDPQGFDDLLSVFDGFPMPEQDPRDQVLPFIGMDANPEMYPDYSPGSHLQPKCSDPLADIMMSLPVYQLGKSSSEDSCKQDAETPTQKESSSGGKTGNNKSQKLKEKNRRAQQKFREKKKEQDREAAGRVGELMAQLKASETHKGMLQRSRWMLTAAALEKDDVLETSARFSPAQGLNGWDTRLVLQLQTAWPQPVLLSPKKIVGMSYIEFSALWQDLAAAMVLQLPAARRDTDGTAAAKLQAMVNELRAMSGFMAMGNGEVLSAFIEAPANKGNTTAWSLVAEMMNVQPYQKQQLRGWREAYLATTGKLYAARANLQAALQRAIDSGIEIGLEPTTGCNLRQLLDANREDLQRVSFDFHTQCWVQGLTAVQTAICVIKAAPAAPDLLTIISTMT
ncbi:hypothetical protein WJX73_001834 [Symbiochloris irregularis]|uniref:BZIP domain-containing protein n=1 Tax=Symbiochloris irregularis TaxID=706552 RepID=A0AAW1NNX5_9CHLO